MRGKAGALRNEKENYKKTLKNKFYLGFVGTTIISLLVFLVLLFFLTSYNTSAGIFALSIFFIPVIIISIGFISYFKFNNLKKEKIYREKKITEILNNEYRQKQKNINRLLNLSQTIKDSEKELDISFIQSEIKNIEDELDFLTKEIKKLT